jgi:hypothetical protein
VEAEIRSGPAESSMRPLWHALAALASILPAAGGALATRGVINAFEGMALTGAGGVGTVSVGLYEANRPLLFAATAAAALAGCLAVVLVRRPQAFPGLLLSLAPVLACVPALLLWTAESFVLKVIAPGVEGTVSDASDASTRLAGLLIASFGIALVVIVLVMAVFAISLARPRSANPALPPAAVWAAMTVLLTIVVLAFYLRSSYLYQVGLTGQL